MKKFLKKALFLTLFSLALTVSAQEAEQQVEEENTIESNDSQKNAIGVTFGLPGYGIYYGRQFNEKLSLRGRASFFSIPLNRDGIELGGRKVNLKGEFEYNSIDVLVDYYPFKSSFKIVAGLSYLTSAEFEATITPADNKEFKYGSITLTEDKIGAITTGADWSGVAPYIGLGFGRAVPKNKVGFGVDGV